MKKILVFGVLVFGLSVRAAEVPLIPEIAPISEAAIRAPLVVEKITPSLSIHRGRV